MANFFSRLISKLFGNKKSLPYTNNSQLVSVSAFPASESSDKNLNSTYSACVNFYGGVISKLFPILSRNFKEVRDYPNLKYLLEFEPNHLQNSANFMKQVAISYYSLNIAVIYIERDWSQLKVDNQVNNLWLIDVTDTNFQVFYNENSIAQNKLFFKFILNGVQVVANVDDLIILARTPTTQNPFFNEDDPIQRTIEIINKNFDGIERAVLNANVIRFLATTTNVVSDQQAKERQEILNNRIKEVDANGALYLDSTQNVIPIPSTPTYQGESLVKPLKDSVYEYFGLNATLIDGSATDDQLNNLIETQIEPLTHEFELELTKKILTKESIAKGLRILIDTSRLFTTSHQHRIQSAQVLISSGKYKPNEIRKLVGIDLLPEEDDEYIERIDRVDSSGNVDEQQGENENANS